MPPSTNKSSTLVDYAGRVNTPLLQPCPALPREAFEAATVRANGWRGCCLDALTRAEMAVTECLAFMAEVPGREKAVDLPHLLGQRVEALATAIGDAGAFAAEGGIARSAVEQLRGHIATRTMLCHGIGRVTLDLQGRYTLVLRRTTFRSNRVERDCLVLTETDAEQLRDELTRMSRLVCSQLGQVRAKLRRGREPTIDEV